MPDAPLIRTATPDDAAALCQFLERFQAEGHPGTFVPDQPLPTVEQEVAWIQSHLDHSASNVWVACAGTAVAGMLNFRGHTKPQLAHGGAFGMSVLREHRGQGIGSGLMNALFTWAGAHPHLTRVELEVLSNNTRAVAFYERHEFTHEGARKGAVRIDDQPHDILLMARAV